MAIIRLDKYLADAGQGTRTQVKEKIKKGMVHLNEQPVKKPDVKIDTEKDIITVAGKQISYSLFEYFMLNKPAGVISATKDAKDKTVIDLINVDKRRDLFPVGRLDKDTEGLLLITNDGALANNLLAPGKHVSKTYYARIIGLVTENMIEYFREGVDIGDDKPTLPATLKIICSGEESEIELTIVEGRYHQVKRMFQAFDMEVVYLKRLSMGPLSLDESLNKGEFRCLTEDEIRMLKEVNNV